jgi:sulfur carrier protein ThiS adenylyltransferase
MGMDRYGRQSRLAEVGPSGQARLRESVVDVRADGLAAQVASRYLAGAGVGRLRVRDSAVADSARAVDPSVVVDVEADLAAPTVEGFDLRHPAARDVAAGAASALRALRSVLGVGEKRS